MTHDPTPRPDDRQARAKELVIDLTRLAPLAPGTTVDIFPHMVDRVLRFANAEAQAAKDAASSAAHDIIFAIRCELEQPHPSMDKIREHLNQWEMRR